MHKFDIHLFNYSCIFSTKIKLSSASGSYSVVLRSTLFVIIFSLKNHNRHINNSVTMKQIRTFTQNCNNQIKKNTLWFINLRNKHQAFSHKLVKRCPILIIFGRNILQIIWLKEVGSFQFSANCYFCAFMGKEKHVFLNHSLNLLMI